MTAVRTAVNPLNFQEIEEQLPENIAVLSIRLDAPSSDIKILLICRGAEVLLEKESDSSGKVSIQAVDENIPKSWFFSYSGIFFMKILINDTPISFGEKEGVSFSFSRISGYDSEYVLDLRAGSAVNPTTPEDAGALAAIQVLLASQAAAISTLSSEVDNKVDAVSGKGLSTNDYTNTEKSNVAAALAGLSGKVDKVNGFGLSSNDYTSTEKTKLQGLSSDAATLNGNPGSYFATAAALATAYTNISNNASAIAANTSAIATHTSQIAGKLSASNNLSDVASLPATKSNLQIDQINNTSDANKPVSSAQATAIALKVDKVTGMGLSTNDYSNTEKSNLASTVSGLSAANTNISANTSAISTANTNIASNTAAIAKKAMVLAATTVKNSAYTASAGDFIPVDLSAGSVAISLPSAPPNVDGAPARIAVKVILLSGTNTCTITRGGTDVFNKVAGSTSLSLSLLNQGFELEYSIATGIWYVIADNITLASLDSRFQPQSNFPVVASYAAMTTAATGAAFKVFQVTTDEDKGQSNTVYVYFPSIGTFWIAANKE